MGCGGSSPAKGTSEDEVRVDVHASARESVSPRPTLGSADEVFDMADTDGDGFLSQEELIAQFRGRGHSAADVEELMQVVTVTTDGLVTRDAWRAGFYRALPTLLEMVRPPPDETFDDLREGKSGCVIANTEERALTLRQLRAVHTHILRRCVNERWTNMKGELLAPEQVSLYDATRYVIKPATAARGCSFVELVALGPQCPVWFVSHWWGEPVILFLRCLEQHARDHKLDDDAPYWICAYANNQHDVGGDVTADPSESSFVKAIELAEGRVLSIVDDAGVTYTRIWCCLEIHLGLKGTYEIYTAKRHRDQFGKQRYAVGLTNGPCEADRGQAAQQTRRQRPFPLDLVRHASMMRVQDGNASKPCDKTHILNYIAGRRGSDLDTSVPPECAEYDATNNSLRGMFAAAAWRLILESGEDMAVHAQQLATSGLRKLSLSLRNCSAFTDAAAQQLATHLPVTLVDLRLVLADSGATAEGSRAVLDSAMQRLAPIGALQIFSMHNCMLDGAIPEGLGACTALWGLRLDDNRLAGVIPHVLGNCTALRQLGLNNNHLTGPIPAELGKCTALQLLTLNDNQLTGPIPAELGACTALRTLALQHNQLTGVIPDALGSCTALEELRLDGNRLVGAMPERLRLVVASS